MNRQKKPRAGAIFKYRVVVLFYAIVFWNIAIRMAIFLRFLGYGGADIREDYSKGMVMFQEQLGWATLIVSAFVFFSWFLNNFVFEKILKRNEVRQILVSVFFIDTLIFLIMGVGLGMSHYIIEKGLSFSDSFLRLEDFLFNNTVLFFFVVVLLVSFVFHLLLTFYQQMGHRVLWKMMLGYYRKPREEEKIFLFLDLQSSSAYAEKLGHSRYSDYIQECFGLLTVPILSTYGRVYQYVGDEVVLTWDATRKNNYRKAVDFFFLYTSVLGKKKAYFENKYGMAPIFTASINAGQVMAAEVGEIKHELAYHGDVLNTAARIQKQCKRYKKPLLATEKFVFKLAGTPSGYSSRFVDDVKFLGKNRRVKLFEIYEAEGPVPEANPSGV